MGWLEIIGLITVVLVCMIAGPYILAGFVFVVCCAGALVAGAASWAKEYGRAFWCGLIESKWWDD